MLYTQEISLEISQFLMQQLHEKCIIILRIKLNKCIKGVSNKQDQNTM